MKVITTKSSTVESIIGDFHARMFAADYKNKITKSDSCNKKEKESYDN